MNINAHGINIKTVENFDTGQLQNPYPILDGFSLLDGFGSVQGCKLKRIVILKNPVLLLDGFSFLDGFSSVQGRLAANENEKICKKLCKN